jgi:glycosyltransferase involved in cell wall biosynthesis
MSLPLVTVLIDTYNEERFVEQAIVSVLEQTFPSREIEILVVDDGSRDRTPEIVQKFEPRLRLIRKANGGQPSSFNLGISQARGQIVAFLDGDDWWAPHKLKEVVDVFNQNPTTGAVGHGYYEVDSEGQTVRSISPVGTSRIKVSDVVTARSFEAVRSLLGTSKLAVRKELLDRIVPIPEAYTHTADAFVFILAAVMAEVTILDRALCFYRVYSEPQWENRDPGRIRRRQRVAMVECVYPRLAALGISREVYEALIQPFKQEHETYDLARYGGNPWRTFQAEKAAYRSDYSNPTLGYRLFKSLVLGLALTMPPRRFYQLKQWYAKKGFRRLREKIGNAAPAAAIGVRRKQVSPDLHSET